LAAISASNAAKASSHLDRRRMKGQGAGGVHLKKRQQNFHGPGMGHGSVRAAQPLGKRLVLRRTTRMVGIVSQQKRKFWWIPPGWEEGAYWRAVSFFRLLVLLKHPCNSNQDSKNLQLFHVFYFIFNYSQSAFKGIQSSFKGIQSGVNLLQFIIEPLI
jgi:hypothetical protein